MPLNWDVDGSESRLCFPHYADIGSLHMEGRFRYFDMKGKVSEWEEVTNFIEDESGEYITQPTKIRACDVEDWRSNLVFDRNNIGKGRFGSAFTFVCVKGS